jgi:hypothetical protein
MLNKRMSQEFQTLLYITDNGPVTTFEIIKFGIENGFTGADNYKRIFVRYGLVNRSEISKMYSNYSGRSQFVYTASKEWKGVMK